MSNTSNRIFGLDVVRSIAILCVLACHFILSWMGKEHTRLSDGSVNCLSLVGVDLFFVLSGYLIGGILIRDLDRSGLNRSTAIEFWRRRWFRTLPNYFAYLALAVVFIRPWKIRIGADTLLYPFFLQNLAWKMHPFFIVSWSLAIEEWFYLLFPLLVAVLTRLGHTRQQSVFSAMLLLMVISPVLRFSVVQPEPFAIHFIVIYRLDAIAMGVGLAFIKRYRQHVWGLISSPGGFVIGLLGMVGMMAYITKIDPEHNPESGPWSRVFVFEGIDFACALLIPWFSTAATVPMPVLSVFTWVSLLSYSLYLCNHMAIVAAGGISARLGIESNRIVRMFMQIGITFIMALLSYYFIERKFLRLRDQTSKGNENMPRDLTNPPELLER